MDALVASFESRISALEGTVSDLRALLPPVTEGECGLMMILDDNDGDHFSIVPSANGKVHDADNCNEDDTDVSLHIGNDDATTHLQAEGILRTGGPNGIILRDENTNGQAQITNVMSILSGAEEFYPDTDGGVAYAANVSEGFHIPNLKYIQDNFVHL